MTEREARRIVYARSNGICEGCGKARAVEWSHRKARSQGGKWTPSNGMHLCRADHAWIHSNPNAANACGWYLRSWQNPAAEPVLLGDRPVLLMDDGSIKQETTT